MADIILFNANVITMDPVHPNAQWIAIRNGRILAVAEDDNFKDLCHKNTKLIDCKGRTVLPGFIDSHLHFYGFAESLVTLNLDPRNNVRSISDIQNKMKQLSKELPSGNWIRARGYNEFYLVEKRHPTRWDLDAAAPSHPTRLTHRSGHAHVLNSLALRLVHISKETADPPTGMIDRDTETGEPTGLLYSMGSYLAKAIPPLENDLMEHGIRLGSQELISLGITSFYDASPRNDLTRWKMFETWKERRLLKSRVTMILGGDGFSEFQKQNFFTRIEPNHLRVGGVKIILHETTGDLSPSQQELDEMVLYIHQSGLQVVIHAVEGKTIEAACRAIECALQKAPRSDHRHRIEHCSVCTPSLAKRLDSLGVIVVTQPSFIYYHGERYLRTVPDSNLRHIYPIATLMKNGVRVAGSSDCPIVPPNPLIGIYSAVSRKTENGESVLSEERISPLEALRMYTGYAAETAFEERIKGSIAPGKLADLVVLNKDPTRVSVDEIKDIQVEMTILDGEVVWDNMS